MSSQPATENENVTPTRQVDHQLRQRTLRIRITDVETGRTKVALTLPVGLVSVAARLGARLLPGSEGEQDIVGAIQRAAHNAPVIVEDEQNGERIEMSLV